MPHAEVTIDIAATPARVWAVLVDVVRWPQWTRTVTSAERLDSGPLAIGSCTRLFQPKLRPAVWQVTQFDESTGVFVWIARNPGVTITAGHYLTPTPDGCRATLTVTFSGLFAPLARRFAGSLTAEYVHTEAASLKRRCES
jgi:Polyketide cyclase / dehydrase and lipid transport